MDLRFRYKVVDGKFVKLKWGERWDSDKEEKDDIQTKIRSRWAK